MSEMDSPPLDAFAAVDRSSWFTYPIPSKTKKGKFYPVQYMPGGTDPYLDIHCPCDGFHWYLMTRLGDDPKPMCDHAKRVMAMVSTDYISWVRYTPKPFRRADLIWYVRHLDKPGISKLMHAALEHLTTHDRIDGDCLDKVIINADRRNPTQIVFRQLQHYGVVVVMDQVKSKNKDKHRQTHNLYRRLVPADVMLELMAEVIRR